MGKYCQVSQFNVEGSFLGFVFKDGYKVKYIRLATAEGEIFIKLAKAIRYSFSYNLTPGDWLQVYGERKFDLKTAELKFKAYEIQRVTPNHSKTTVKQEPLVTEVPAKPKANILVCQKSDCWKRGGKEVCHALQQEISDRGLDDQVTIKQTGCMKQCKAGPNIIVNKTRYSRIEAEQVPDIIDKHFTPEPQPVVANPILCQL